MKIVMKFGGTSVGSEPALRQVLTIVQRAYAESHAVVVVASAMSGVTNRLIEAARQAEAGDETAAHAARQDIEARHADTTAIFLGDNPLRETVMNSIRELLDEFEMLCHGIHVLGELTPRALDVISGMGERMSVRQLAAMLSHAGTPAVALDATDLIVTDHQHGAATPLAGETSAKTQVALAPILAAGQVPIVTGFIAATVDGIPTTLGRGGSDYSATILGRAWAADEVWIWTDVDGVMSTDPRVVPTASTIARLSYGEVGELAYFGAKVLHPRAIRPARQANIPVRILNTFNPEHPGTHISRETGAEQKAVKAITAIRDLSLINVTGTGMIGVPGVAGRTFSAVARAGSNVLMISQSSSEQSICFVVNTVDVPRVKAALEAELAYELNRRDLDSISVQDGVVIMAVVGAAMRGQPGVAGRVFGALGQAGINIIAIAQGSSEYNISVVIAHGEADEAVRLVHTAFNLDIQTGSDTGVSRPPAT